MKTLTFARSLNDGDMEEIRGYQGPPGLGIAKPPDSRHWYVYHLRSGKTPYPFGFNSRKAASRFANALVAYADFGQDVDAIVAKHDKVSWANLTIEIADKVEADPTYGDPDYMPEDVPRALPMVTVPGGFTVRSKELYAALKGTSAAVKLCGVVVNPSVLRELARIHPLLELRPGRGEVRFVSPDGRHKVRLLDGARVKHKGQGYAAELRPTVRCTPQHALAAAD